MSRKGCGVLGLARELRLVNLGLHALVAGASVFACLRTDDVGKQFMEFVCADVAESLMPGGVVVGTFVGLREKCTFRACWDEVTQGNLVKRRQTCLGPSFDDQANLIGVRSENDALCASEDHDVVFHGQRGD